MKEGLESFKKIQQEVLVENLLNSLKLKEVEFEFELLKNTSCGEKLIEKKKVEVELNKKRKVFLKDKSARFLLVCLL